MAYKYRGTNHTVEEAPKPWHPSTSFIPAKCGTYAGYRQHQKHGNELCQPCRDAANTYWRNRYHDRKHEPARVYGFDPIYCGTYAGYARHRRSTVPPCEACKTAYADYMHEYRANRKAMPA